MNRDAAESYSTSLAKIGEGWLEQVAWAFQQDIPQALGMSRAQWMDTYYKNPPKLEPEERKEAVRELTTPVQDGGMGLTNREAADVLGVAETTIRRDLGGATYVAPRSGGELNPQVDGTLAMVDATNVALESEPYQAPKTTRELLAQSDQNDWRTPRKYLDAARGVLGEIDLDPASSAEANETVRASIFYTEEDDGLKQPWKGRVWLNPPYGGQARLFIERLVREYEVGNVTAGLALINSHPTETKWFQELFRYSICFIRGRIDFGGPSREISSSSTHGSAIAYLGDDLTAFAREFKQFGAVVRHV